MAMVLLLGGILFLPGLGHRHLWTPDEGRYGEIAREMLESGDWVTPHLDYTLYFEKPPLVYWSVALSMGAFGVSAIPARLPVALFGILGLISVYLLGKELESARAGLLAAAILATSPLYFVLSRFLVLDMALTAWTALAITVHMIAVRRDRPRLAALAGLALAAAVLAKGPVAGVIFVFAVVPVWLLDRTARPRLPHWLWLTLVFLVAAVPWFALVSARNPTFAHFFFVHEHLDRFLGGSHDRPGPFYYFVPVLAFGLFPWIFHLRPTEIPVETRRWLAPWILLTFAFFSASGSKLPPYVLPLFPPLALVIAVTLERSREEPSSRRRMATTTAWVGLGTGLLGVAVLVVSPRVETFMLTSTHPTLGVMLVTYGLGSLALGAWARKTDSRDLVGPLFVASCLLMAGVELASKGYEVRRDTLPFVDKIREERKPGEDVVIYGPLESANSLPFYLGERVKLSAHHYSELTMAADMKRPEDEGWLIDPIALEQRMEPQNPRTWYLTDQKTFTYFRDLPKLRVVEKLRHGRMILFTNRE